LPDLVILLGNYSDKFIYAGLFLILFLCGLGLPIPEELTLLAAGFFVHLGMIRFYPALATVFAGVLIGDMAMYSIGRKWGRGIITHKHIRKFFSDRRLERARQFFCDHGSKTIFIARFLSGFRVAVFLAAGTMGMMPAKFLILDTLAALIMVPLLLLLGYSFGANIGWLTNLFTRIDFLLKLGAVLAGTAVVVFFLFKRKKSAGHR
jgi:membrane protein DedA with SNARE-associated domain